MAGRADTAAMLAFRFARFLAGLPGRITAELAQHRNRTGAMVESVGQQFSGTRGFTLIELLVVILIIGILAAVAIPSFLNQKSKAFDATAKELAHSAEIAAETYATANGSYAGITPAVLHTYEATIPIAAGGGNAFLFAASGTATGYTVTAQAATTNDTFSIVRAANGALSRVCSPVGVGGCNPAGSW